ncbi:MAG: 4'-phosphopantetheinyl transferase superfamily protein [Gammaproteobacteria bacterium]|nr:4'-phosphopantetheinyl transferase superfamily protein [Gammaproteobacteria bacterium]
MSYTPKSEQLGQLLDWQSAATDAPPNLEDRQIHLWSLPLHLSDSEVERAKLMLNDTQRDKFARRATPELQNAYLAGRYHLMTLLGAYSRVDPHRLQLSYNRLNKPYLDPNPEDIQFNFTDTITAQGSCGLLAFSRSFALGVDIESLARRSNFAAIVAKRFTAAETDYVTESNGEINAARFLACWTRKEAFGKATGRGINFKMRNIDLASPGSFELDFASDDQPGRPFRLQQFQMGNDFIASLVHEGHQSLPIRAFKSANHIP